MGQFETLGVLSKVFQKFSKEERMVQFEMLAGSFFNSKGFSKVFKGGKRMVQIEMLGARGSLFIVLSLVIQRKHGKGTGKIEGLTNHLY